MVSIKSFHKICFLLCALVLLEGCASTEELFVEYDDQFCAAPEYASRTQSVVPAVYIDSDSTTEKKVPPVWEPAIYFDTDSTVVKKAAVARIQKNIETLSKLTSHKISLHGFADPQGSDAYNKVLSDNRVESVRDMLISDFGLSADRIVRSSSGASSLSKSGTRGPVATDRRVDMILLDSELAPVATQPPIRAATSPDHEQSAL